MRKPASHAEHFSVSLEQAAFCLEHLRIANELNSFIAPSHRPSKKNTYENQMPPSTGICCNLSYALLSKL